MALKTKKMPKVRICDATACSYNRNRICNTFAITVGGETHDCPLCDTEIEKTGKAGLPNVQGQVGACHQDDCSFNDSLECSYSKGISVKVHNEHAECSTYLPVKKI